MRFVSCCLLLILTALQVVPATAQTPGTNQPAAKAPAASAPTNAPAASPPADTTADQRPITLDIGQQALLSRFDRFEKEILQMAEQMRRGDPERADLLFRAHSRSQQERVMAQMRAIQELLARKDPQYGDSIQRQEELLKSLKVLLELMQSENRLSEIEAERARIQDLLKDVNRLVGKERDVRAATERGEDAGRSAERQKDAADETNKVVDKIAEQDQKKAAQDSSPRPSDGKPSEPQAGEQKNGDSKPMPAGGDSKKPGDSSPPDGQKPMPGQPMPSPEGKPQPGQPQPGQPQQGQPQQGQPQEGQPGQPQSGESQSSEAQDQQRQTPGRQDLQRAKEAMDRAIEELKKDQREKASREQDEAIRRLLEAKEKLEEILRQLREEEKALTLAGLEARFRKMLAAQLLIYQETVRVAGSSTDSDSTRLARSRQLATQEQEIATELDKSLVLLREEGSSVAFPQAAEAIREDMQTVTRRLDEGKVDAVTQSTEQAVIEALEEMIAAFKQEMEKQKQQQGEGQSQQQGEQGDDPLVDAISELKMLRSLQLRINRRTRDLSKLIQGEQAAQPDIVEQLQMLSRRQAKLQQAAYDLATGRNK